MLAVKKVVGSIPREHTGMMVLLAPSSSVRNLGVIFNDQLTFKDHIAKTARSCRFALHNIRKIRPFLTQHAAQLLLQALVISRLDYCNAPLAGLPSCTIKPRAVVLESGLGLVLDSLVFGLGLGHRTRQMFKLVSTESSNICFFFSLSKQRLACSANG